MQKKMGVAEAEEKKNEYNQRPWNRLGVDSLKMIKIHCCWSMTWEKIVCKLILDNICLLNSTVERWAIYEDTATSQKIQLRHRRFQGRKDMMVENSYACSRAKSARLATGCCNMKMKAKDEKWFLGFWVYKCVAVSCRAQEEGRVQYSK